MKSRKTAMKPLGASLASLFTQLEQRSQAALDLTARVREALPSPEKEHVVSTAYKDGTLTVAADSAAWSTRIRYAQEELLARLRAQGETQFTKVRVRVGRKKKGSG